MSTPPNNNQKTPRQLFWEELDNLDRFFTPIPDQAWIVPYIQNQLMTERANQLSIDTFNAMMNHHLDGFK